MTMPYQPPQGFPQYPQQYQPPQGFPQQPMPQQGFPQGFPQQPAPTPQQPQVDASLGDFFNQPSTGGGPSLKFKDKPIGTRYAGIVARKMNNGDVRPQTNSSGQVQTYKDGRAKLVMVVPLVVQAGPEYPDGRASLWVKGQMRDELARAMAEAGAPEGAPEEGAGIEVELTGQRPIPNMNPANQYRIAYTRPAGAAPVPEPVQAANPGGSGEQPPVEAPVAAAQPAPAAPQQPAPAGGGYGQQQAPAGLSPEQQQLLNQLTNKQQPAA